MSLFSATLSTALALLALGAILLWNGPALARAAKQFPRSPAATFVCFGGASAWFLWRIAHLSAADFGDYRVALLCLFGVVAVGAYFVARDFLAVRGLAILCLLCAQPLLAAAFLQPPQSRLFLVGFTYVVLIPAGLVLGAMPYLLRDLLAWLWQKPARPRVLGAAFAAYGILLTAVAYTYPA